jgi:hypothetical protein
MRILSIIGLSSLLTILLWDLKYDHNAPIVSYAYYQGDRNAETIFKLAIPIIIILSFLPLLINLVFKRKLLDILTFLISLPALYLFTQVLIPNQEKLVVLEVTDPTLSNHYKINKDNHLIVFIIVSACLILQVIAMSCSNCKSTTKVEEKKN